MRRFVLVLFLVQAAALAVPTAAAQSTPVTFYGHVADGGGSFWMNDNQEDPNHDGTNGGYGEGTSATWVLPHEPGLDEPLHLEQGGSIPMSVWVGSNTHGGSVTVTSTLYAGETIVAQASGDANYLGVATSYVEVSMEAEALVDVIDGDFTWEIEADGPFSAIYLRVEEGRWSSFTLPLVPPPSPQSSATVYYQDFDEELLQVSLDSRDPSTASYVYNWTAPGAVFLQFSGSVEAGGAEGTFFDQTGSLWHHQFSGMSDNGQETLDAQAGSTQLWLNLTDFVGSLNVQVFPDGYQESGSGNQSSTQPGDETGGEAGGEASDAGEDGGNDGDANGDADDAGDESDAGDADAGKDSPSFALPLLLLGLLALALRRK